VGVYISIKHSLLIFYWGGLLKQWGAWNMAIQSNGSHSVRVNNAQHKQLHHHKQHAVNQQQTPIIPTSGNAPTSTPSINGLNLNA
jgi:hypothetical protein